MFENCVEKDTIVDETKVDLNLVVVDLGKVGLVVDSIGDLDLEDNGVGMTDKDVRVVEGLADLVTESDNDLVTKHLLVCYIINS